MVTTLTPLISPSTASGCTTSNNPFPRRSRITLQPTPAPCPSHPVFLLAPAHVMREPLGTSLLLSTAAQTTPTPWASWPRSFARLVFQMSLSGPRIKWEYSRDWPVSVPITVLAWFVRRCSVAMRCRVARA